MRWLMLFPVLLTVPAVSAATIQRRRTEVVATVKGDLTGSGHRDVVTLTRSVTRDRGGVDQRYRLTVNGSAAVEVRSARSLRIVDIDRKDRWRELLVEETGPSDVDEAQIFWYDGKQLREVASLDIHQSFLGNGIVHNVRWEGFWQSTHKYVLGKDHRLKEMPQELYQVDLTLTLKKPLALQTKRDSKEVIANLRVGSKVALLASDAQGWFLLCSENGITGWTERSKIVSSFGLVDLP